MSRTGSLSRQHQRGGMPRHHAINRDPLRRVIAEDGEYETLECGHRILARYDMIGRTYAERRRCWRCREPQP